MSDLISRAELKKTAKRIESMPWGDEDGSRIEFKWTSEELEALIDKAPSVEPKKGRWVVKEVFDNSSNAIDEWQSALCSVCNTYHTTPYMYYFDNFNYCPNCGASMTEVEE